MALPRVQHFAMAAEAEFLIAEESADRRRAGSFVEFPGQAAEPRPHPFFIGTGLTGRLGLDAFQQVGDEGRMFFSASGRPPPGDRMRSGDRSRRTCYGKAYFV